MYIINEETCTWYILPKWGILFLATDNVINIFPPPNPYSDNLISINVLTLENYLNKPLLVAYEYYLIVIGGVDRDNIPSSYIYIYNW